MRKFVLTFGLLAGFVMSAMFVITIPFHDQMEQGTGMLIGYTSMVLASLMIYFGVRQYRDTVTGGEIRFGRAFRVAMGISAVAVACYVVTWEVVYSNFYTDFGDKYAVAQLERERAKGATAEQLAAKEAELKAFWDRYRNSVLMRVGFTTLEPLPVVLLFSLGTAGLLSRKRAAA